MSAQSSQITSFVLATTMAASVTLLLGWPSHVNAVGGAEQAARQQAELAEREASPPNVALARNEAKMGDLLVTAALVESEAADRHQVIRLECKNPTEQRISGKIQVELTRTTGSSMERVMPRPQIAWRHPEAVDVEPGQTLIREILLPKKIGAEVTRVAKARKHAEGSESARLPNIYFDVLAEPMDALAKRSKAPRRAISSRFSMLVPSSRVELGF